MTPGTLLAIQVLGGIVTFVISVASSMFVAGTRWGRVESKMETMADRLAKIEGMFTLRLKDTDADQAIYRDRQ